MAGAAEADAERTWQVSHQLRPFATLPPPPFFIAIFMPIGQAGAGGGALGLHIGSRRESQLGGGSRGGSGGESKASLGAGSRVSSGGVPKALSGSRLEPEVGCDWVSSESLPAFPSFGELKFDLPPLPRLLPRWTHERLYLLEGRLSVEPRLSAEPRPRVASSALQYHATIPTVGAPTIPSRAQTVALAGRVGVGAAVALAVGLMAVRSIGPSTATLWRLALRGRHQQ